MPLQVKSNGKLLFLGGGNLANGCCCGCTNDVTCFMRSLSEALRLIAIPNSFFSNQFGGDIGTAWRCTLAGDCPPENETGIEQCFYAADYTASLEWLYADVTLIVANYNAVKNYFLKTAEVEGAATLENYTGADDYAIPGGTVTAGNYLAILTDLVPLINGLLTVWAPTTQAHFNSKNLFSTNNWAASCASAKACGLSTYPTVDYKSGITVTAACAVYSVDAETNQGVGVWQEVATTGFGDFSANLYNGKCTFRAKLCGLDENATSSANIYLVCSARNDGVSSANPEPVAADSLFHLWGAAVPNVDIQTDFVGDIEATFDASCASNKTGWQLDNQAIILVRNLTFAASLECGVAPDESIPTPCDSCVPERNAGNCVDPLTGYPINTDIQYLNRGTNSGICWGEWQTDKYVPMLSGELLLSLDATIPGITVSRTFTQQTSGKVRILFKHLTHDSSAGCGDDPEGVIMIITPTGSGLSGINWYHFPCEDPSVLTLLVANDGGFASGYNDYADKDLMLELDFTAQKVRFYIAAGGSINPLAPPAVFHESTYGGVMLSVSGFTFYAQTDGPDTSASFTAVEVYNVG